MSDIVLLHTRADEVIAQRILDDLDDAEFDVWSEDELNAGSAEWKQAIRSAIKSTEVVVVLLSPHAAKSTPLEEAIGMARMNKAMIFPVLVDGELKQATPGGLRVDQFTDLRGTYDDGIDDLLDMLDDYFERWDDDDRDDDDDDFDDDDDDFEDGDDFFYEDDDDLDFADDFDDGDDDFVADDDDF